LFLISLIYHIDLHSSICFSHLEPEKPVTHAHLKRLKSSSQLPPLKHGLDAHSSVWEVYKRERESDIKSFLFIFIFILTQRAPNRPFGQTHLKPPGRSRQGAPFSQGEIGEHSSKSNKIINNLFKAFERQNQQMINRFLTDLTIFSRKSSGAFAPETTDMINTGRPVDART
jgi:hypothetical protein